MTDSEKIFGAKIGDIVFGARLVDKFNEDHMVYCLSGNYQYFLPEENLDEDSFLMDFDTCLASQVITNDGGVEYKYLH